MRSVRSALALAVALLAGLPQSSPAQSSHALLVGTEVTRLGQASGGAVNADWLQWGDGRVFGLGLTLGQVDGKPWARADGQISRRVGVASNLAVSGEVGAGRKPDDTSYGILKTSITLTTPVSHGRAWLGLSLEGFSIEGRETLVFEPSLDLRLGRGVVTTRYGRSFGGDVGAEFLLGQLRTPTPAFDVLVGALIGRALHSPASRAADPLNQLSGTWEVYGGVIVNLLGRPTTVVLKHRASDVASEQSVLVSTRLHIR